MTATPDSGRQGGTVDAHLYLLATMALFGSAFASSKVIVGYMPHSVAAVLRFGGGALILLLISVMFGRRAGAFSWRDSMRAGLVGLLGVFAYNFFFFWGLTLAPSIDGSVIVPVLSPVITTGILLVMRREQPSVARISGLLLGLGGAAVFFAGAGGGIDGQRVAGDLVFLTGAVAWAAYSITSKRVLHRMDPLGATTAATAVGAFALALLAIPSVPDVDWSGIPSYAWLNVAYLALGPTAIAYLFFYRGLRSVSPSTATVMMFAVPIFGITCAVYFLGESFRTMQIVGAVVMLAGALLAVSEQVLRGMRRPAPAPHASAEPTAGEVAAPNAAEASSTR